MLNLGAAVGLARLWRLKWRWSGVLRLAAIGALVATVCTTLLFTAAAYNNYPGGIALQRAHAYYSNLRSHGDSPVAIHIAVAPAQTGVSRFGESTSGMFVYSKAEQWTDDVSPTDFDMLLTGPEGRDMYPNRTVAFAVEVCLACPQL